MPLNDVYQMKLVTFLTDQLGLVIRHYAVTSAAAPEPTRTLIANAFFTNFTASLQPLITADASIRGWTCRLVAPGPPSVEDHSSQAAVPGTAATPAAPRQTSGLIKLGTAFAGRSSRGRSFIPFPSSGAVIAGGLMSATYLANLTTLANALLQPVTVPNGAGSIVLTPVVFHRKDRTFTPLSFVSARNVWATQRRRGSFGRTNLQPF